MKRQCSTHGRLGWTFTANANRKYSATWHKQRRAECGPGALPASAPSRGVRKGRRLGCACTERPLDRTRAQPRSTRARPRRGAGRGGLGCAPFADTANAPRTASQAAPDLAERTRRSAYFGAPGGHARAQLPRRLRVVGAAASARLTHRVPCSAHGGAPGSGLGRTDATRVGRCISRPRAHTLPHSRCGRL